MINILKQIFKLFSFQSKFYLNFFQLVLCQVFFIFSHLHLIKLINMTKAITNNPNLKLLHSIHDQINFLKQFNTQQLNQIAEKGNFFVFSQNTIIAQQNQQIDFIGIILEGKVNVSGKKQKRGIGYIIGELGYFNLIQKHAYSVIGDTDGIILALRLEDINKMSSQIRKIITFFTIKESMETLRNPNRNQQPQLQLVQQKRISYMLNSTVKTLFTEVFDSKQKIQFLKVFPFARYTLKSQIISKNDDPYFLYVVQGELIIKSGVQNQTKQIVKLIAGEFYNCQGFLLNYTPNTNIYCLTQDAIVLKVNRRLMENKFQPNTLIRLYNFVLRKVINDNKYQIISYEKRKEIQLQNSNQNYKNKWTIFSKGNYEILPLTLPKVHKQVDKSKSTTKDTQKQVKQTFQSTLFREHFQRIQNSKNVKTTSSINSKLNKMITMKTQKNQQKISPVEQQLKDAKKQLQMLNAKMKYFQQNFSKVKLEMIQYKSKNNLNAVFKQINQLGSKRFKAQSTGSDVSKVMTLKKAFEQHMKQNRIMEVVARCAYKWLWTVRRRKNSNKLRTTIG